MTLTQPNGIEIYVTLKTSDDFDKWIAIIKNNQISIANQ